MPYANQIIQFLKQFVVMTGRDQSIDILKGIAIYAVVTGHIIAWFFRDFSVGNIPSEASILWRAIYSFHMPLFIFLSGYVFMNPEKSYPGKYMVKRFCSYLIPFVTMGLLLYAWRGGKIDNYWYFRTLVELSIILYLSIKVVSCITSKHVPIISFILYFCIVKLCKVMISTNVYFDEMLDAAHLNLGLYFGLGYLFRSYHKQVEKMLINQYVMFISMLLFFANIVTELAPHAVRALVAIMFLLNLSHVVVRSFSCNHINNVGKHSLGIYLIHFFFTFHLYGVGEWIVNISKWGGGKFPYSTIGHGNPDGDSHCRNLYAC